MLRDAILGRCRLISCGVTNDFPSYRQLKVETRHEMRLRKDVEAEIARNGKLLMMAPPTVESWKKQGGQSSRQRLCGSCWPMTGSLAWSAG